MNSNDILQIESIEHLDLTVEELLTCLDWISPAFAAWCMACGHVCISIWWSGRPPAYYCGTLDKQGVEVGGKVIVAGNGFVITVPDYQEIEARRILRRAGAILA